MDKIQFHKEYVSTEDDLVAEKNPDFDWKKAESQFREWAREDLAKILDRFREQEERSI